MESFAGNSFCEVLLPLPLPGTFTYAVPLEMAEDVVPGVRVLVAFGKKTYAGLVRELHDRRPGDFEAKALLSVLSPLPLVNEKQLAFWDWMADYYLCSTGEVMEAALPSVFKLSSESRFCIHEDYNGDLEGLSREEIIVLDAVGIRKTLTLKEAFRILPRRKVMSLLKSLGEKGILVIAEDIREKRKPRKETWYALHPDYSSEVSLCDLLDQLERKARRQAETLKAFLGLMEENGDDSVRHSELILDGKAGPAMIKALLEKGAIVKEERVLSRLPVIKSNREVSTIVFSEAQQTAFLALKAQMSSRAVVLLHGVTSSGKTELYIHLIKETLAQGKQVLYLLPEIALTTQLINRLTRYFGSRAGVFHSRLNEQERAEVYLNVAGLSAAGVDRCDIILGARSAVFLPFESLGLVIVDEEHDVSFKQQNPAPRYHGRDSAIMLAHIHGAPVILGSATPSLESFANCLSGKYGKVDLMERYGGVKLPDIHIVDLKSEVRRGRLKGHFSQTLLDQIGETLSRGEQLILFQNRRGFSLLCKCQSCQWSPQCKHCDVTLTYHKYDGRMHCHYCGFAGDPPAACPDCGSTDLRMVGFGTEKIEEELPLYFPSIRVARLDLDSTRAKNAFQKILQDFGDRKIDVLVGTQMVTKGLDFEHVHLVGIMNADNLFSFPDFRANERGYQLMAQVSGRSGRKLKQGKVLIQTWNPTHPLIKKVKENDYVGFYNAEMADRKNYDYPPFSRLIILSIKHRDANVVKEASFSLARALRKELGTRVLGPEFAMIARVQNQYIRQIMIKFGRDMSPSHIRNLIREQMELLMADVRFRGVRIIPDIDPQ